MALFGNDSSETQRLLEDHQAGGPGALDQLLNRHRPYLRKLVALRLDPQLLARVDPSDIVQEAQMEAVRRLDDFVDKRPMPFRLWLRQIAYDRLLMVRRQHRGAARRDISRDMSLSERSSFALAQQLLATGSTPSEQLTRRELTHRVRLALGKLSEKDREILLMRNYEGLSNLEVSQVLGINPAAASQRYGRALLRLRDFLLSDGISEKDA